MIGTTELITILAIGVLLFGASAIPKLAKSIGQAKTEFEKGIKSNYSSEEKKLKSSKKKEKNHD